jgi:hypothetical protein
MARHKYPLTHIYDHARGDGWILTASAPTAEWERIPNGHRLELVLYYTDEQCIETHEVRNTKHSSASTFIDQYLDIGAKLGSYPGSSPQVGVDYEDQPRAVRMQRHATDIYQAAEEARGMSPTIALRAAEAFGSTWRDKRALAWEERVDKVGTGRASRIVEAL